MRRVFAVDIERARVLEWSPALGTWSPLELSAQIDDPALAAALPLEPLVHAAKVDDAMARALLVKRNPVLEADRAKTLAEGKREGLAEGSARGRAEGLLVLLAARGVVLEEADRARILGEQDAARLDRWIARAASCTTLAEVLADG